jgi:hypothetical protein
VVSAHSTLLHSVVEIEALVLSIDQSSSNQRIAGLAVAGNCVAVVIGFAFGA